MPQPQNDLVSQVATRWYANFSLQHNVHCIPVDEVSVVVGCLVQMVRSLTSAC